MIVDSFMVIYFGVRFVQFSIMSVKSARLINEQINIVQINGSLLSFVLRGSIINFVVSMLYDKGSCCALSFKNISYRLCYEIHIVHYRDYPLEDHKL